MGGREKVKTSIVVGRRLWEEFRSSVASERGLRALSQAVEEAIEDEMADLALADAVERLLGGRAQPVTPGQVKLVRPRAATDAGREAHEMREPRPEGGLP